MGGLAGVVQPQVDALGVEAAWRVGNWELLAEFVQNAEEGNLVLDAQDEWEVKLGHLLCASQQRCSFQTWLPDKFGSTI